MSLPVPVAEVLLRDDSRVSIRSTTRRSWDFLKTDFWVLLGVSALVCVLVSVAFQFYVTALFLIGPVAAGGMLYFVKRIRGEAVSLDFLFEGFRRQFSALAKINLVMMIPAIPATLVVYVLGFYLFVTRQPNDMASSIQLAIWMTGLAFLFITGLSILLQFVALGVMLCLEHNLSCRETLALLWKTTKRHGGKIALFSIFWSLFSWVGLLFLYFGAFLVWAWYSVANAYLYEDLFRVRHALKNPDAETPSIQ